MPPVKLPRRVPMMVCEERGSRKYLGRKIDMDSEEILTVQNWVLSGL